VSASSDPHADLEAEIGKNGADLATVAPGQQGERTDTSPHRAEKLWTPGKSTRLRAILRAPDLVQNLYRQGLLTANPSPPSPLLRGAARARPGVGSLVAAALAGGPPRR
jgi:hypothetical protein